MKKTSLYLLSLIIIGIVCLSVILPAIRMVSIGMEGFKVGYEAGVNNSNPIELWAPIDVTFSPQTQTLLQQKDSLQFQDGHNLPVIYDHLAVMLPSEKVSSAWKWISAITYPLEILLLIPLIWKFLAFMIHISKQQIFVRPNVKLLRQFSWILIGIAFLEIISGIASELYFRNMNLGVDGYSLSASWSFPWSNLLLGCLGMLMAEIWARGLEIQEEHELTI